MKKVLSVLLALVMMLSLTAVAFAATITVSSQAEAQDALDNAVPGTTIQLVAGVDYGVLYLRPSSNPNVTTVVDWPYNNYGLETYSCFENLTIIGAEGATVDAIEIECGFYYHTAHSQSATYPVMMSMIELKNVLIEGVTFTGEGGYDAQGYGNAINLSGNDSGIGIRVDGLELRNCVMNNSGNNARLMYKTGATGNTFDYNVGGTTGVFVATMSDIVITGCVLNGGYMGIELRECENLEISNNTFNVSNRNVLLATNSGETYSGTVEISDNISKNSPERFIRATGIGDAELIVKGNEITDYEGGDEDCIKIDGVTGKATIEANIIPEDTRISLPNISTDIVAMETNDDGEIVGGEFNVAPNTDLMADGSTILVGNNFISKGDDNTITSECAHNGDWEWGCNEDIHVKYCLICEEFFGDEEPHEFGEWTVTKEPTKIHKGERVRVCEICDYEEVETLSRVSGEDEGHLVIPESQKPAEDKDTGKANPATGSTEFVNVAIALGTVSLAAAAAVVLKK